MKKLHQSSIKMRSGTYFIHFLKYEISKLLKLTVIFIIFEDAKRKRQDKMCFWG